MREASGMTQAADKVGVPNSVRGSGPGVPDSWEVHRGQATLFQEGGKAQATITQESEGSTGQLWGSLGPGASKAGG